MREYKLIVDGASNAIARLNEMRKYYDDLQIHAMTQDDDRDQPFSILASYRKLGVEPQLHGLQVGDPKPIPTSREGWQCPICKSVMAPFMPYCMNCKGNDEKR